MNEDVLNQFKEILKEKDIDIDSILNNDKNNETIENSDSSSNQSQNGIDIEMLLKIKTLLENSSENQNSSNLLLALKPYMRDSRKNKIDKYAQILKFAKIFKVLGGDK